MHTLLIVMSVVSAAVAAPISEPRSLARAAGAVGKGVATGGGLAAFLGLLGVVGDKTNSKRDVSLSDIEKYINIEKRDVAGAAATAVEDSLGAVIGKGALGGVGSVISGFGVGENMKLKEHLPREIELQSHDPRSTGKSLAGAVGSLGASSESILGKAFDKLRKIIPRETNLNDLD